MICPKCSHWVAPPARTCTHCKHTVPAPQPPPKVETKPTPQPTPNSGTKPADHTQPTHPRVEVKPTEHTQVPAPKVETKPAPKQSTAEPKAPAPQKTPSSQVEKPIEKPKPATDSHPRIPPEVIAEDIKGMNAALPWGLTGLLGTAVVFLAFALLHSSGTGTPSVLPPANASSAAVVAPALLPTSAPIIPQFRPGPSFDEVDARMDDRGFALTEAQKQTYWSTVAGTQIRWEGVIEEVHLSGGGELTLKCGPQTLYSDTIVRLDGSQVSSLASISKGQRVQFTGFLEDHTGSGYTITNGHIN